MEGLNKKPNPKEYQNYLLFNVARVCQDIFKCLIYIKLNMFRGNNTFLETFLENENLIFDGAYNLYMQDYLNFNTTLAGEVISNGNYEYDNDNSVGLC